MFQTIQHNNINLHFRDEGEGKVLVLLHGFLESLEIWNKFTTELAKGFRIISIDLPGHGLSGCTGEVHTMEFMANCVKAVLDELNIKKCVIVGHSMGGYITLAFCEKYLYMLKGIILFHSSASADSEEKKKDRENAILSVKNDHITFIKQTITGLFAPDNLEKFRPQVNEMVSLAIKTPKEGIIAALNGMKLRKDRGELLRRMQLPVLYIIGKQDPRLLLENMLQEICLPGQSLTLMIDNCGHMGFIEAEKETLKALKFSTHWFFSY